MTEEERARVANEAVTICGAWQIESELAWAMGFIEPGATVIEIGSHMGGTLYAWKQAGADRIIAVDLEPPIDLWGAEFVQGDSHDVATRDAVAQMLGGDKADFVFIDGDHSLESVTRDWELWGPLGEVVAFHDINQDSSGCQVKQLWDRLRDRAIAERIDDEPGGWAGIGVIRGEEASRGAS
jgi:hypothetical protein